MAKQVINVGSAANDGTGDTLRAAAQKVNSNFTEVYNDIQSFEQEINFAGTESISSDNNLLHISGGTDGISRIDLNAGANTTTITSNTHTWTFSDDGSLVFPDSSVQTTAFTGTAIDQTARDTGNSAFDKANSATISAQAAHDASNTKLEFTSVPASSVGQSGDLTNDVAANATYLYYCTSDYDGVTDIWKRIAWSADTW